MAARSPPARGAQAALQGPDPPPLAAAGRTARQTTRRCFSPPGAQRAELSHGFSQVPVNDSWCKSCRRCVCTAQVTSELQYSCSSGHRSASWSHGEGPRPSSQLCPAATGEQHWSRSGLSDTQLMGNVLPLETSSSATSNGTKKNPKC